jgi:ornithine decarboxylase
MACAYDSHGELDKLVQATRDARDLTLCVRLSVPNTHSRIKLGAKYGINSKDAPSLLKRARQLSEKLGISFHVGSQAMAPAAFHTAFEHVQKAIALSGVIVDVVNVGGGFPSAYPGMMPPPLAEYVSVIETGFSSLLTTQACELWCEPGRALSAETASLIVRVEHRKGADLYINDGVFGALHDAGRLGWRYPVRCLGERDIAAPILPFSFYGPTCDDDDWMKGPFMLPETVGAGSYVEIGMLGAYGTALRTRFNGFGSYREAELLDPPMHTMFDQTGLDYAIEGLTSPGQAATGEDH